MNQATIPLPEYVAGELRAEIARQGRSIKSVAEAIGDDVSYDWLQQRLRGQIETKLDDLERIAAALGRPVAYFLPAAS